MNSSKDLPLVALALTVCLPLGPALANARAHGKGAARKAAKRAPVASHGDASAWKPDAKLLSRLQP